MPHELHHSLRNSTAALHSRLDSAIMVDAITGSEPLLSGYLYDFHSALGVCWPDIDWEILRDLGLGDIDLRKRRYHNLTEDLIAWGIPVPALPDARPGTVGRSVGIAYVLEGSMHGGRAILAKASANLGGIPAGRRRFLEGFGKDTPRLWSGFLEWLGTLPDDPSLSAEACESAKGAFGNFLVSLRSPDPLLS